MKDEPEEPAGSAFDIVSKQRLYDGFVKLDRYELRQRTFTGALSPQLTREVVVGHEAVAVLCYDPDRASVVLIEQLRLPAAIAGLSPVQREIVAGITEPGEPPERVALREVREETGLEVTAPLIPIARTITTPGYSTEVVHYYCGRVDSGRAEAYGGLAEEHEDIRIVVQPVTEFRADLEEGRVTNSFTLIAGLWLTGNRDKIHDTWGINRA